MACGLPSVRFIVPVDPSLSNKYVLVRNSVEACILNFKLVPAGPSMGVTDDADVGFFLKRARVIQRTLGDSNYHLDRVAKMNNY